MKSKRLATWILLLLAWAGSAVWQWSEYNRLRRLAFDELVKSEIVLAIAVESDDGDRTHAAKKLGISRRALIYKLRVIEAEAK